MPPCHNPALPPRVTPIGTGANRLASAALIRSNAQMSKRHTQQNSPKAPDRFEWDFSTCPSDEAHFCRRYEYARENEGLKAEVAQLRASNRWHTGLFPGDWAHYERREF